jgi:hypothetical protein
MPSLIGDVRCGSCVIICRRRERGQRSAQRVEGSTGDFDYRSALTALRVGADSLLENMGYKIQTLQLLLAFGSRRFHLDVNAGDAQTLGCVVPYLRGEEQ